MNCLRLAILATAVIGISQVGAAQATPVTYTFSGNGGGTAGGAAFTGPFSFVFNADTSAIDKSGAPFFRLNNVPGTFTEGGFSATLAPTVTIVATADPVTPRINFFNATFDNGLGFQDSALTGYDLSTSIGPITVTSPGTPNSFLTPTFNNSSDGFSTTGGLVELTSDTSLTFTARLASVPEPGSLALLGIGLAAIGLVRPQRRRPQSVARTL